MTMTLRAFLKLLADHGVMAGDSWFTWRVVLIAAVGEPLQPAEVARFREVAGIDPPQGLLQLAAFFVGRRGGKDTAAAVLVVYLALCRVWPLAVGEIGMVLVAAVDRDQAQIAFRRVLGILQAVPVLSAEIANITRETIELDNGIEIRVVTADGASVRGRTLVAAVLDEAAYMGHEALVELLRALRPATATTPGSLIAVITTVYASQGPAYELFRQWGESVAGQLVIRGTTRDFNPTVPQEFVDREIALDPQGASAEYLSIPRTDVARLFDAPLVDGVTRSDHRELPRLPNLNGRPLRYHAGVDVSGGRGDAAAAAVAHLDGDKVIVDAVRYWPAPHDPLVVAAEVAEFLQGYGLRVAVADQYGAELARSVYREAGVELKSAEVTRSEGYLHALPLFTTGRVEIPAEPRLRAELLGLERRTGRSGRDSVDHPPHGHDDVANAVALAAHAANRVRGVSGGVVVVQSERYWEQVAEFGSGPFG